MLAVLEPGSCGSNGKSAKSVVPSQCELFGDSLYTHAQDGLWNISQMVDELVGV